MTDPSVSLIISAQQAIAASKGKQKVPREQYIKDLARHVEQDLNEEERLVLYMALRNKLMSKTCYQCGCMKPIFGGELMWPDGDMSKPKKFKCADCRGVL